MARSLVVMGSRGPRRLGMAGQPGSEAALDQVVARPAGPDAHGDSGSSVRPNPPAPDAAASQDAAVLRVPERRFLRGRGLRACAASLLAILGSTAVPAGEGDGEVWREPEPAIPPAHERSLLDDYAVRMWRVGDGLPSDRAMALTATSDGYVWIGTAAGVARFDGVRFDRFDHANVPQMSNHRIRLLATDERDRVWLQAEDGEFLMFGDRGWQIPRFRGEKWTAIFQFHGRPGMELVARSSQGWLRATEIGGETPGARDPAWERDPRWDKDAGDVLNLGRAWYAVSREGFVTGEVNASASARFRLPFSPSAPNFAATLRPTVDGALWCAAGLFGVDERLRLYCHAEGRLLLVDDAAWMPSRVPLPLGADPEQGVWHGMGAGRIGRTSVGGRLRYRLPPGYENAVLMDVVAGSDRCLWIALEEHGLMQLRSRRAQSVRPQDGLPHAVVRTVLAEESTGAWVGTDDGIARVMPGKVPGAWMAAPDGLSGHSVRALTRDARGDLWAGTARGLFVQRAGEWRAVELPRVRYGEDGSFLGSLKVRDLLARPEGDLLVVTANQLAVVPTGGGPAWTLAALPTVLPVDLLADRGGGYWLATEQAGVWRLDKDLVAAGHGRPWAPVPEFPDDRSRLVPEYAWRATNGLPSEQAWELSQDDEGALWIAGPRGLVRVPPGARPGEAGTAPFVFTPREGLPEIAFNSVLEDPWDSLWLGGEGGLYRVPLRALRDVACGRAERVSVEAFSTFDGLPHEETSGRVSRPGAALGADGRVWIATTGGLACLPPSPARGSGAGPGVVIEEARADGRIMGTTLPQLPYGGSPLGPRERAGASPTPTPNPAPVRFLGEGPPLPPGHGRVIEFRFTAFDAVAPRDLRFRYQLEGHETAWHDLGDRRFVHFAGLRPGTYRFRVAAAGVDGNWSALPAQYRFTLRPYPWQTTWFVVSAGVGLAGIVTAGVAWRVRQVRRFEGLRRRAEQADLQKRLARDLHDGVGSGLARLAILSNLPGDESRDPERVARQFRELSGAVQDLARTVREITWSANPSPISLESLLAQLAQLLAEFLGAAGIRCRTVLPLDFPEIQLTPDQRTNLYFAIKEAATNVVRHARASEAWFKVDIANGQLEIELEDDGSGFDMASVSPATPAVPGQGGNGLPNLRARIAMLGGELRLRRRSEGGTSLRISMPLHRLGPGHHGGGKGR